MNHVERAMSQPADKVLDPMAKQAAKHAAVVCCVDDDVIAVKEIYRAIISVANGYAAALSRPTAGDEPTEAQIEAAARAIHRTFWLRTYGDEIGTGEAVIRETWPAAREKYMTEAAAGLRAALAVPANQSLSGQTKP